MAHHKNQLKKPPKNQLRKLSKNLENGVSLKIARQKPEEDLGSCLDALFHTHKCQSIQSNCSLESAEKPVALELNLRE
jgi:hypothetical protein